MWYWGGVIAGIVVPCIIQVLLLYRYYFKPRFSKPLPPLIKPIDLKKTPEEIREMEELDRSSGEESCMWVNVIFARLWSELRDGEAMKREISRAIHGELIDLKRDPIGIILAEPSQILLKDYYIGDSAPIFDNVTVISRNTKNNNQPSSPTSPTSSSTSSTSSATSNNNNDNTSSPNRNFSQGSSNSQESSKFRKPDAELTLAFDVSYVGGLSFIAEIGTTIGLTFTFSIRITEISGRMFYQFRQVPQSGYSFGFYYMPKFQTDVQVLVNGYEFYFLTQLFKSQIPKLIQNKFVLPNMKTKWFIHAPEQPPYPWDLKEGEEESALYDWKPKPFDFKQAEEIRADPNISRDHERTEEEIERDEEFEDILDSQLADEAKNQKSHSLGYPRKRKAKDKNIPYKISTM